MAMAAEVQMDGLNLWDELDAIIRTTRRRGARVEAGGRMRCRRCFGALRAAVPQPERPRGRS